MDRQYMPYWGSGPGQQYPPPQVKEEPDYSKMGYEDTPGGGMKREQPDAGNEAVPRGYAAANTNVKVEPPEIKQELVEPKQEPSEERRGEKRQAPNEYGPPDTKRYRPEAIKDHTDDDPVWDKEAVILDWYNSDLSLNINKENFLGAEPMTSHGFAYVWHGVRSTYGFLRGRLFFEVKVEDHLDVPHLEGEQHPHVMRCGWSIDDAGLTLGEEPFSYGYGGTGKASTDLKFKDYGRPFGKGDVVGCFLDMDSEPIMMSFSVNGRSLGKCYEVSHRSLEGKALFPHILTKNCVFKVNFGSEYPWFQPLLRYDFVGQVPLQERVLGTQGPQTREQSEVIMMVGLPACGKTTWIEKYCKENPQKKYYVLGTNSLIDKMKVNGLTRKRNYHGRWDVLIENCTKCLNTLLTMSYKRKRNYIIDQTNVYPSARRRKMRGFPGFFRRAMVLCPSDAELTQRTEKQIRQEGKNVPDAAIMEMKANFTLPEEEDDIFDSVEFSELPREEATRLVEQYSKDAQSAGFVKKPPFRGGGRGGGNFRGGWNRDRNSSNNSRGGYNRDNVGGNNRDSGNNQSGEGIQGGFGKDNRGGFGRGGFERGGFGNRGGFDRGNNNSRGGFDRGSDSSRGGFDRGSGGYDRGSSNSREGSDRGGDSSRGSFDRRGDDNRGGFGRGSDSVRGGYSRGSDSTRGSFGRGSLGNRDGSRGYNNMGRDNYGSGQDSSNSYQGYNRENDRDMQRGGGFGAGNRDSDRGRDDNSRGRYSLDSFGKNRDSDTTRDNRGGDSGFGQNSVGGNRDMPRGGLDMDRGNRDGHRGGDNSRGSYGGDADRGGYGQDNSGGSSNMQGGFSRDTQRSMDRDYTRGAGDNFGNLASRSYSLDREGDTRSDSSNLGGYGRDSYGGNGRDAQRGFGSHDSLSRSVTDGGYGSQQGSGGSSQQQTYARPFDRSSSPGGVGVAGGAGWSQQGGSTTYAGSGGAGGNQPWNYGSSYGGQRP